MTASLAPLRIDGDMALHPARLLPGGRHDKRLGRIDDGAGPPVSDARRNPIFQETRHVRRSA
jgi:hypothetical protein